MAISSIIDFVSECWTWTFEIYESMCRLCYVLCESPCHRCGGGCEEVRWESDGSQLTVAVSCITLKGHCSGGRHDRHLNVWLMKSALSWGLHLLSCYYLIEYKSRQSERLQRTPCLGPLSMPHILQRSDTPRLVILQRISNSQTLTRRISFLPTTQMSTASRLYNLSRDHKKYKDSLGTMNFMAIHPLFRYFSRKHHGPTDGHQERGC